MEKVYGWSTLQKSTENSPKPPPTNGDGGETQNIGRVFEMEGREKKREGKGPNPVLCVWASKI